MQHCVADWRQQMLWGLQQKQTKIVTGPAGRRPSSACAVHSVWSGHLLHLDWPRMADGQVSMTLTTLRPPGHLLQQERRDFEAGQPQQPNNLDLYRCA